MATQNSITVGVNVTDNGTTKQVHKSVKDLHSELKSTQQTAKSLSGTVAGAGGTGGSRRALQAAYGGAQSMTGEQYGNLRGSAGATGASARDFANQAQGLGGLVRLYATLAANMFAASAAFNALSSAMDTSNMIRGLDQLGAASGVALGSLSKRLSEATDGAISLREAMEATVKASSSGMNSEQILRMGKVAKQASLALGVNMSDAISRISRGITKLEPELLDELGLFTKTGQAADDYAKRVGKTANQLTDFERRQAFANAVLEEGERKFGKINLEANPYTQLLASLKNVAFTGLEVLNKVLGPIVDVLASSPSALIGIIATLGATLVKQALPALGQFKDGLKASAEAAQQLAKMRADDAKAAQKQVQELTANRIEEIWQEKVNKLHEIDNQLKQVTPKISAANKKMFEAKDIDDYREAIKSASKSVTGLSTQLAKAEATGGSAQYINELKQRIDYTKQWISTAKGAIVAQEATIAAQEASAESNAMVRRNLELATRAQDAATKSNIVSNAAYNASLVGLRGSFELFQQDLEKSGLKFEGFTGRVSKGALYLKAGFAAVGGFISNIASGIGGVIQTVTILVTAFNIVDGILSKTAKEMQGFNEATKRADEAGQNLIRTMASIREKPLFDRTNIDSMIAASNAISEVTNSVSDLIVKQEKLMQKMSDSTWDTLVNSIKKLWGGNVESEFASSLSNAVFTALREVAGSSEAAALRKLTATALGLPEDFTEKGLQKAIRKYGASSEAVQKYRQALKDLGISAQNSAQSAKTLMEALEGIKTSYASFRKEYEVKDSLAKLGLELASSASKLDDALKDPVIGLRVLYDVAQDIEKLSLFSPQTISGILNAQSAFKALATDIKANEEALKQAELAAAAAIAALEKAQSDGDIVFKPKLEEEVERTKAEEARYKKLAGDLRIQAVNLTDSFSKSLGKEQFQRGADLLANGIKRAWAEVGTATQSAILDALGDAEGVAAERNKLEMAKLSAQKAELEERRKMLLALQQNTAQLALSNAQKSYDTAVASQAAGQSEAESRRLGLPTVSQAADALKVAQTQANIIQNIADGSRKSIDNLKAGVEAGTIALGKEADWYLSLISQVEGLNIEIAKIGDQMSASDFKLKTETILESARAEERRGKQLLDNLAEEEKALDIQYNKAQLAEDEYLLRKQAFKEQRELQQFDIEQKKLLANYAVQQAVLDSKSASNTAKSIAQDNQRNILIDLRNNSLKLANTLQDSELETLQKLRKIEQDREDAAQRLLDIRSKSEEEQRSFEREMRQLNQEYGSSTGMSDTDLKKLENANRLADLEQDTTEARLRAEKEYADYRRETLRKIEATKDTETKNNLATELAAETTLYQQRLQNIDSLGKRRLEVLQQQIYKESFLGQLETTFQDAIATAIFDGGKQGSQKLKDFLKSSFRKFVIDVVINPVVSSLTGGLQGLLSFAGSGGSSLASGGNILSTISNVWGAFSGGMSASLGSLAVSAGNAFGISALSSFGTGLQGGTLAAGLAGPTTAGASGAMGLGSMMSTALPWLVGGFMVLDALGAFKGKTPHRGGVGAYNAAGGTMKGQEANLAIGFGISPGEMLEEINVGSADLAKGAVIMLDSFAQAFGKEAGYFVGTGFADDTSSDGAWGALLIKRGNEVLKNWGRGRDKWPGREFANAEAGRAQYQAAFVQDVRDVMIQAAPGWADAILMELGDAPNMEQLAGAVTTIANINAALASLGNTLPNFVNLTDEAITSLLSMTGGIENLLSASNAYYEAFYTEEERLSRLTTQLQSSMRTLGFSLPKTREEFRKLVEAQNLNTEAGRNMYAALMSLVPAFIQVTEATTSTEENLKQVYENRKSELEDLISVWERVSDSLTEYIRNLQQGSQSILTPRQKFELAQREYNTAIAAIKDPATDPKERAKLAEQFTGLSNTLLDTGKAYLASSSGYTQLFNTVVGDATKLAADATVLATDFKTELSALNTMAEQLGIIQQEATQSTDFLGEIDSFYKNKFGTVVAEAVYAAYSTYEGRSGFGTSATNIDIPGFEYWATNVDRISTEFASIPARAAGGYTGPGLTLVGEDGPELVNFNNPATIYSADQTRGMFASPIKGMQMQQVVNELVSLRQEVAQLRKDQQQQTGDLIVSNYDANARAAEKVTTEIANASTDANWQQRNKVVVV